MSAPKPKREVTILDDREIVTFPKLNQPVKQHVVTYQADTYPPRTVFIRSEDYSEKSLQEAIKVDLAEIEKSKSRTMAI
jgi:hypothetical protein